MIPAGSTAGPRQLEGIEEVYYVIKGLGTVSIGSDSAAIKADDAFYGLLGESMKFANSGKEDLELLVIGLPPPNKRHRLMSLAKPKAMVLQMDFIVTRENSEAFEKMYHSIYVPAMTVQKGYLESKLLRLYPENLEKEIQGEPTAYNYQIQISFDTGRKPAASGWPVLNI